MIKKTLYFGNDCYLHTKDEQLIVVYPGSEKKDISVPIEDIGVIILDAHRLTISRNLMSKLLHNNVALISCDEKHMPQGLMLNLDGNHVQREKLGYQLNSSKPLKKNLWQQTIRIKIQNQAALLNLLGYNIDNMNYWARNVRSGDPDNYEGRAAAYYWKTIFSDYIEKFKRGRYEADPNHLLNYGYAILRAVIARSLVASGCLPTLGIHHRNKYNAYCLADDIMEPYRPFADKIVLEIIESGFETEKLTPTIKQKLLQIPAIDVIIDNKSSPLMIAAQRTSASLSACFEGIQRKLLYPELI